MNNVLLIDIETSPKLAYVWDMWKQNINQDMLLDRGYLMTSSWTMLGSNKIYSQRCKLNKDLTIDDYDLTVELLELLDRSDYVIAHNGKKFDIPFIKARALVHGLTPPSPFKVIDTLEIARKEFLFTRNTLENLAQELKLPDKKLSHSKYSGAKLWVECLKGNEDAWQEMLTYNQMDVKVLEEVYLKLRPWDSKSFNIASEVSENISDFMCPKCGSTHIQLRGYYFTNSGKYHKYVCKECGGWSRARYTQNSLETRKTILKGL